jgi:hypothetical protein
MSADLGVSVLHHLWQLAYDVDFWR